MRLFLGSDLAEDGRQRFLGGLGEAARAAGQLFLVAVGRGDRLETGRRGRRRAETRRRLALLGDAALEQLLQVRLQFRLVELVDGLQVRQDGVALQPHQRVDDRLDGADRRVRLPVPPHRRRVRLFRFQPFTNGVQCVSRMTCSRRKTIVGLGIDDHKSFVRLHLDWLLERNETDLEEEVEVDENGADVDRVDPVVEVAHDAPQALHDQFHVLCVGVVAAHGVVQQPQQGAARSSNIQVEQRLESRTYRCSESCDLYHPPPVATDLVMAVWSDFSTILRTRTLRARTT